MDKKKIILDACCGSRMFWFDKENENTLYVDNRNEVCDSYGKKIAVVPDMIADFRNLPFENNSFKMVVFDPPHLIQAGKNGWQAKQYGSLDKTGWQEYIKQGFQECLRVLDNFGVLIFKWNETDIPVSKIIEIIGIQPLFGHHSGKSSRTHWLCFMNIENNNI